MIGPPDIPAFAKVARNAWPSAEAVCVHTLLDLGLDHFEVEYLSL
jgi:hypothetical protein